MAKCYTNMRGLKFFFFLFSLEVFPIQRIHHLVFDKSDLLISIVKLITFVWLNQRRKRCQPSQDPENVLPELA